MWKLFSVFLVTTGLMCDCYWLSSVITNNWVYLLPVHCVYRLEEFLLSSEDFTVKVVAFAAICSSCLVNVKYSSLRVKTLEAVNSLAMAMKGMACMCIGI